jgi:hypothetical protein
LSLKPGVTLPQALPLRILSKIANPKDGSGVASMPYYLKSTHAFKQKLFTK